MRWARRRQTLIALGIVCILGLLTALGWLLFVYEPPSCSDGVLNQNENGIDCEGVCARMCVVPRVDALWTRAVQNADGVYHGVSLIKNPLPNARGDSISYVMSLYDAQNILVAERRGTLSLDPGESRVVFEPNIIVGERTPVRALLKVDGGTFTRADPTARPVKVVVGAVDEKAQTLTATLENTTAAPITNVVADALLFDREGVVVTASETVLPVLPAHTRREVVFTWSKAFLRPITTSDVIVRIDAGL